MLLATGFVSILKLPVCACLNKDGRDLLLSATLLRSQGLAVYACTTVSTVAALFCDRGTSGCPNLGPRVPSPLHTTRTRCRHMHAHTKTGPGVTSGASGVYADEIRPHLSYHDV